MDAFRRSIYSLACGAWLILAPTSSPAIALDDDFGFSSGTHSFRTGTIMQRAFSAEDSDAIFIMNNSPLLYRKPANSMQVANLERRLEESLASARDGSNRDWRWLATLLEGGACFYRKLNRKADALMLLSELVDLLEQHAPNSADLCEAKVVFAKTASAMRQFEQAEDSLLGALAISQDLYGTHHIKVAQIDSALYFLYLDMNKPDLAIRYRQDALAATRVDVVAAEDQKCFEQNAATWPSIVRTVESVATNQDIAANESTADAAAKAALERYLKGLVPRETTRGKKSDDKAPPPPYRMNGGDDAQ